MNHVNILGVKISNLDKKSILKKIDSFLTDGGQHYIVTPNPEIILEAQSSEEFFHILNMADIAIADGIGLKFAAWISRANLKRITGADLTKDILKIAEKKDLKVVVFSLKGGLSNKDEIREAVKRKHPSLRFMVEEIDREWEMPYYQDVNIFKPDIIFVALGAPYQEKFIFHQLPKMPYVKFAIGVGGTFDFLTGKIKRAPKFIRLLGFEWMWRVIKQPKGRLKRLKRIYNAVVKFPWKVVKTRLINPFFYRPNVSCLLYKKENDGYKVLLVERAHEPGHWQQPQGGTDGEDLETAGLRELSEELNTYNFKAVKVFKNVHSYKFGQSIGKYDCAKKSSMGYKGQKQGLLIAEFFGKDKDISVNYWDHSAWKWVDIKNLVDSVSPIRKEATRKFLKKFNEAILLNK